MKTYEVILTKSYMLTIEAASEEIAADVATFFTGDVQDISSKREQEEYDFKIKEIDCRENEAIFWGEVEA